MHSRVFHCVVIAVICGLAIVVRPARCDDVKIKAHNEAGPILEQARKTIERGLTFIEKDAAKWRKERGCATCHHGTMTVWALGEAKSQGYVVGAETLANAVQWTKDQFVPRLDQSRDTRPGWSMGNTPGLYLGVMTQDLPILSRTELTRLADYLERVMNSSHVFPGIYGVSGGEKTPPEVFKAPKHRRFQALSS
jgi:hypothetical protein